MGDNGNALATGLAAQVGVVGQAILDWASGLIRGIPVHYLTYAAGGTLLFILASIALKVATRPRYAIRASLVSQAEKVLLDALDDAVGRKYRIALKPRVADIVTLEGGSRQRRQEGLQKLFGMHFDYALCEPNTMSVVAVVELDDKSHNKKQVRRRDRLKDEACRQAGLPIVRIRASSGYNAGMLEKNIFDKVNQPEGYEG